MGTELNIPLDPDFLRVMLFDNGGAFAGTISQQDDEAVFSTAKSGSEIDSRIIKLDDIQNHENPLITLEEGTGPAEMGEVYKALRKIVQHAWVSGKYDASTPWFNMDDYLVSVLKVEKKASADHLGLIIYGVGKEGPHKASPKAECLTDLGNAKKWVLRGAVGGEVTLGPIKNYGPDIPSFRVIAQDGGNGKLDIYLAGPQSVLQLSGALKGQQKYEGGLPVGLGDALLVAPRYDIQDPGK